MKKLQTLIAFTFLMANVFGQSTELSMKQSAVEKRTTQTYLDPILNLTSSNLNYGNLNTALKDYKKSVRGVQVGMSFQAGITPMFSIVPEFYFMMNGGKLKANNPLTLDETTLHFYSLELPVLARIHLCNLYLNAGPSIGYTLSGSTKTKDQSKAMSFSNSTGDFKRLDAAIQAGGGYMFPWKNKRIALDLRYNYGLTNVSNEKEMYNRSFIVSLHVAKAWKSNPFASKQNYTPFKN